MSLLLFIAPRSFAETRTLSVHPTVEHPLIADLDPLFGIPWKLLCLPRLRQGVQYDFEFIDGETGYLSLMLNHWTDSGELWRYQNGSWRQIDLSVISGHYLGKLFARSGDDIWLAWQPRLAIKQNLLHYDGAEWEEIVTPNAERIRSIYMTSAASGWAGCEWGQIMQFDGERWTLQPSPTEMHLERIFLLNDTTGFASGLKKRNTLHFFKYDGRDWRPALVENETWMALLCAPSTIQTVPDSRRSQEQERFHWLLRPVADHDTLILDTPVDLSQLVMVHPSGTHLSGCLARSFSDAKMDWIAHLEEPIQQEGLYARLTIHFFNQLGEKRILTIRQPMSETPLPRFHYRVNYAGGILITEHGIAVADFNRDGSEDVFAVATGADNHLILTKAPAREGWLREVAAEVGLAGKDLLDNGLINYDEGASAADVDNDGDQDILVTSLYGRNLLYRQTGRFRFREESGRAGIGDCQARSCSAVWADVNQNGALDLYISNEDSSNRLYLNNGAGIFHDVTDSAGLRMARSGGGSAFADIDNDNDLDLFVPRYGLANLLYLHEGVVGPERIPRFREIGRTAGIAGGDTLARSTSGVFADVDNDGDLDLFVTNLMTSNRLYVNDGHGRFTDETDLRGLSLTDLCQTALFLDADNDGDLDLLAGVRGLNRYYQNQGQGVFAEHTKEAGIYLTAISTGMACFDYGADGDLDVYLGQDQTQSAMYVNSTDNGEYLQVNVVGDRSNRDAIGARVYLYRQHRPDVAGDLLAMREINGGCGYNSMNSRLVHFGVAGRDTLMLCVRFPSGVLRTISGLTAGRRLTVYESSGWPRLAVLAHKWLTRVRHNPEPRAALGLFLFFLGLLVLFEWRQLRSHSWPGRSILLMVVLPALLMALFLILLAHQTGWLRYGLALAVPLIAWSLALGIYHSIQAAPGCTAEEMEKLYLATAAFFHGGWGARKLNRIEFFCSNWSQSELRTEQVTSVFEQAIADYFTMIVPELQKIVEGSAGVRTLAPLRQRLQNVLLNLAQSLSELKVELRLGNGHHIDTVLQHCRILQIELGSLRKQIASRFVCQVDRLVMETVPHYRQNGATIRLVRCSPAALWAQVPAAAFSQIFENLLDNALAAVRGAAVQTIRVELDANADYLFVRVKDSGPGVPAEVKPLLFHQRVSSKGAENGFGLYHSHAILEKYAGAIRLLEESDGACFEIVLKRITYEPPVAAFVD